jgi:hypothetical protein
MTFCQPWTPTESRMPQSERTCHTILNSPLGSSRNQSHQAMLTEAREPGQMTFNLCMHRTRRERKGGPERS